MGLVITQHGDDIRGTQQVRHGLPVCRLDRSNANAIGDAQGQRASLQLALLGPRTRDHEHRRRPAGQDVRHGVHDSMMPLVPLESTNRHDQRARSGRGTRARRRQVRAIRDDLESTPRDTKAGSEDVALEP
jgi:hypothetical protein